MPEVLHISLINLGDSRSSMEEFIPPSSDRSDELEVCINSAVFTVVSVKLTTSAQVLLLLQKFFNSIRSLGPLVSELLII